MKRYNFFIYENFQFPMIGTHSVNHPDSGKILVQFPGNSILRILQIKLRGRNVYVWVF